MLPVNPIPPGSLAAHVLAGKPASRPFLPDTASDFDTTGMTAGLPGSAFRTASPEAEEALGRILAGEGDFVSTGQQPGLFLGPRYTIYKAASAVARAQRRSALTGRPCLALFWIASDDHDWEEVARCRILTGDGDLEELSLEPATGRAARSVGESRLGRDVKALTRRLENAVTGSAYGSAAGWLEEAVAGYLPGRTLSGAFAEGMVNVFAGHPIVFLDSSSPEVRRASRSFYRRVLERPADILDSMASGRRVVKEAGYDPPLQPPDDGLQIFVDVGDGRRHLRADDAGFRLGSVRWSQAKLRELLDEESAAFTPAAALRPVLESALLPVGETVLGPGEIAYWAQLPPLFEALSVRRPRVRLRDAWLAVEPRVARWLDGLSVAARDVAFGGDGEKAWVRTKVPPDVAAAFDEASSAVTTGFDSLRSAIESEFPGLLSAEGKARHRAGEALSELRSTVERGVAEREKVALERLRRARMHLRPGGRAQERTLAGVSLYGRYGPAWIEDLIEASGE